MQGLFACGKPDRGSAGGVRQWGGQVYGPSHTVRQSPPTVGGRSAEHDEVCDKDRRAVLDEAVGRRAVKHAKGSRVTAYDSAKNLAKTSDPGRTNVDRGVRAFAGRPVPGMDRFAVRRRELSFGL